MLVHRLRVDVTYTITDECYVEEADGSLSVQPSDEDTFAALCNRCESPVEAVETETSALQHETAIA